MNQRKSGCWGRIVALGLPQTVIGIVLFSSAVEAGMENVRFALDYKPKYIYSKAIPYLCDNPATTTEEPNYSPNYTNTPCSSYDVTCEPLGPGQVYLVIGRAGTEGVSGVSFGIAYDGSSRVGIDPAYVTWTPCADGLSFPSSDGVHGLFPEPGGGLRITWNLTTSCQTETISGYGVHAVVGVFYVYAYSDAMFRVTPNNNIQDGPEAAIMNCAGVTTDLVDVWGLPIVNDLMGQVGFNRTGFSPCWFDVDPSYAGQLCTVPAIPTTWGRMKSLYKGKN